jgi:O-antigen ligase
MLKSFFTAPAVFCTLLFIVFPVCVYYQLPDPFISPRVLLISSATAVFCLAFFKQDSRPAINISVYAFAAFLLLNAVSIFKSLNPGDAWYEWMKTFLGLPLLLLTALMFKKEDTRNLLLKFSQACILILSAVYVYQWIHFLNNQKLEFVFDLRVHIASTFGNKNFYAEVVCLLLPLSVISFFKFKKFWRWISTLNVLCILASIALAESYAVIGALMVAGLIASIMYYSSLHPDKFSAAKVLISASAVLAIVILIVLKSGSFAGFNRRIEVMAGYIMNPEKMDTTVRANSNSTFERLMLWRNSIELVKESPVTGCGLANWKLLYPKFGIGGTRYIEGGNVHYEHPHNDYLLIASEAGVPALIAFIVFLLSLAWFAVKGLRSGQDRLWLGGILFAVIVFMVTEFFSFPRVRFYGWILLCIYGGLLESLRQDGSNLKLLTAKNWKALLIIFAAISCWSMTAGISRINGEVHSSQVLMAKNQKNFARLVRESEKASSWYYPVDETATPFTWYKGMALFYSRDVAGAKTAYEDALKKNPFHIQLLNDLATAYEQSGERERAIGIYQRALTVTPLFPHTLLNISACYFNSGKRDSAYIYIDKVYGIKLSWREKNSYDVFLPAILREKIYSDSLSFPSDIRRQAISIAADTARVDSIYRLSKTHRVSFEAAFADVIRNR